MSARGRVLVLQLRLVLAQSRADAARVLASALAVALGAAFVVVVTGLAASSERAVLDAVARQYRSVAAVVVGEASGTDPQGLVDVARAARGLGAAAVVDAGAHAEVSAVGAPAGDGRAVSVVDVTPAGPLRWEQTRTGRLPSRPGEVAVGAATGLEPGDTVVVRQSPWGNITEAILAAAPSATLTVVGVVGGSGDFARSSTPVLLVSPDQGAALGAVPQQVRVATLPGTTQEQVVSRLRAAVQGPGARALTLTTGTDAARAVAKNYTGGTAGVSAALGVFVVVALLVAALVIANTFSVVLAQRVRELALLRCVGATRSQVRRSVLGEALLLGAVASVLGAGLGALALRAVLAELERTALPVPLGEVVVPASGVVVAVVVGTVTCVAAAALPVRVAVRVPPLAALRPLETVVRPRGSRPWRVAAASTLLVVSSAVLVVAASSSELVVAVGAGVLGFLSVAVLVRPALVPLVGLLSRPARRLGGVPAQLATTGVRRHPGRTAASALALLVGITLAAAFVTGAASTRSTVESQLARTYPVDVVAQAGSTPLPGTLVDRVRSLPGVEAATVLSGATVTVAGQEVGARGVDADSSRAVLRSTDGVLVPGPGQVVVDPSLAEQAGITDGSTVPVVGSTATRDLRVVLGPTGGGPGTVLLDRRTAGALAPSAAAELWVRLTDGAGTQHALVEVSRTITTASPAAALTARVQARAGLEGVLRTLLLVVLALLGVSLVIALLGVSNTLALSALERRRESALLRAVGGTRAQLASTVVWEALLVSVVTALVGTALGAGYGLLGARAGLGELQVDLPWGQLGLIAGGSVLAAVIASLVPAWRSTRGAVVGMLAHGG